MGDWDEIILAAGGSTEGLIALAMLVFASLALAFFRKDHWGVRFGVFCMLVISAGLAVYAVRGKLPPAGDPQVGYVYYETGISGGLTNDGRLQLLRDGPRDYESLREGDILEAADGVNFQNQPTKGVPRFVLRQGDCVTILELTRAVETKEARSGGWLKVKESSCAS